MSPKLATYVSWEEMYGKRPTKEEIVDLIRPLDRMHTVILLARCNMQLALDRFHDDQSYTVSLQRLLVANFISEEIQKKLVERYGKEDYFRYAFHMQQILTLVKIAVDECAVSGGVRPDEDREAGYILGQALLMTNDLLFSGSTDKRFPNRKSLKKKLTAMQLSVGPGFEISNPPEIQSSLVRMDIMLHDTLREIVTDFDMSKIFKEHAGFDLSAYVDMVFGLVSHFLTITKDEMEKGSAKYLVNLETFFQKASQDEVRKFWKLELAKLDDIKKEISKSSGLKYHQNFTPFRMKPLIQINAQTAICLTPHFLQEKLETGLFWAILNTVSGEKERDALFNGWGLLFEKYIDWLLRSAIRADKETLVSFPKFIDTGDEAFDGMVVAGNHLAVLEYKGGFLKSEAKYAEDEKIFTEDLDLKFGVGRGAGVEQLARKIGQIFSREEGERRNIEGLERNNVKYVSPILVVQEPFVSSMFTAQYLAIVFRDLMRKQDVMKEIICKGLIVLDVSDLENLRRYIEAGSITFTDTIRGRASKGDAALDFREFLTGYFEANKIEHIPDKLFDQRFHQVVERVGKRFFGEEFSTDLKRNTN